MTTTNQAFIKVYRHDVAETVPSSPAAAQIGRPHVAAIHASIEFVAAPNYITRPTGQQSTVATLFATSIDVLPPPAEHPAAISRLDMEESGKNRSTPQMRRPLSRHIDASATTKKPLSAFIVRQGSTEATTTRYDVSELRAGTTVASFRWPAVCRMLSQQCAAELDGVVDHVQSYAAGGRIVLGLIGLFPKTGCTTTALCLAARLAGRGCRTILVDGNFYSPRLAKWLDVVPTVGWQEVLENRSPVADAIVHAVDDRLDVLALSTNWPVDPLGVVAGPQMTQSAALLRRTYELTLVDLGAFFDPRSQPIALELVRNMGVDAVVAVAEPQAMDQRDLATVAEHLGQSGCELAGIILNRIAKPQTAET